MRHHIEDISTPLREKMFTEGLEVLTEPVIDKEMRFGKPVLTLTTVRVISVVLGTVLEERVWGRRIDI